MECQINDLIVHYEVYGDDHPVIILNGAGPDHHCMSGPLEPVFEKQSGWKRFYLDLPGTGKTKAKEWITTSDQILSIVLGFVDSVIPDQHFALVGSSYGGYLARGVIYRRPALVDGLLMICPAVIADRKKRTLPQHVALVRDVRFMDSLEPNQRKLFESFAVVQTKRTWERTQDEVITGLDIADKEFFSRLQAHGYVFSFGVDDMPSSFDKPTLILLGRQDAMVGYSDAWGIVENFSRATFAVLDRAGHNLPIEQEALFTVLVSEWLECMEEDLARAA